MADNRFHELKALLDSVADDFNKFYEKGNKAAGTRVRASMKDLRDLAFDIRKHVQDMKNSGDTAAAAPAKKAAPKKAAAKPAAKPAAKKK
jgi:cell division septum initiation protein DivIVA